MKLRQNLTLLLLIIFTLSAAAFSQKSTDEFFSSAESGFKIKMPKTPTDTETEASELSSGTTYTWEEGVKYQVIVKSISFRVPVSDEHKVMFLAAFKKGLIEGAKSPENSSKSYAFKSNKGEEITLNFLTKFRSVTRSFFVGQRFFSLSITYPIDLPDFKESDMMAILDSFDTVEKP